MNLTTMRYFVTICEQRSFTKAADILYTTQPTLSKAIAAWEEELGVLLFIRAKKSIQLTTAGEICLEESREILRRCDILPEKLHRVGDGIRGTIRIGYLVSMDMSVLSNLLLRFGKLYPQIDVRTEASLHVADLHNRLNNGYIDVAISYMSKSQNESNYTLVPILENQLLIAVSTDHPLAKSGITSIDLRELANESFILFDRTISPDSVDYEISLCRLAGFTPKAVDYAKNGPSLLLSVASGRGIGFISSIFIADVPQGVHLLKLNGIPKSPPFYAICRANELPSSVMSFLEYASRFYITGNDVNLN